MVMEMFRGVWAYELMDAVAAEDAERLERWRLQGITPRRAARLIFRSIMEQCYHHRVFHADPHAGNLIFLPGGTLAYIDFGMVGWLDERQWRQQYTLFQRIAEERLHAAYEAMLETLEPLRVQTLSSFETEFKGHLRDWMLAARNPRSTVDEKSTGRFLWRATNAIRTAGLRLPWSVMRLHRTTVTSDMLELKLDPTLDLVIEMRNFFREDACRAALAADSAEELATTTALQARQLRESQNVWQNVLHFLQDRLPSLVRNYGDSLSRFERSTNLIFRYMRATCVMLAALLVFLKEWRPPATGLLAELHVVHNHLQTGFTFVAAGALLFAAWVLGRLIRFYEETD
jgi:predicted unusual protein kinase regulating ubiquinone biosynthesis (AarF/ABC1/UbiB family)